MNINMFLNNSDELELHLCNSEIQKVKLVAHDQYTILTKNRMYFKHAISVIISKTKRKNACQKNVQNTFLLKCRNKAVKVVLKHSKPLSTKIESFDSYYVFGVFADNKTIAINKSDIIYIELD